MSLIAMSDRADVNSNRVTAHLVAIDMSPKVS